MKKIIIASALMFSFVLEARPLHVTTSCGTQVTIQMDDNATLSQIHTAVVNLNQAHCGTKNVKVTLTLASNFY